MDAMDVDAAQPPPLPGGNGFYDVADVFREAAADMARGEMVLMDGFSLQDAMSALEIGEPRLDSGVVPPGEPPRPPFDAGAPLLPQEVCWILDRSFACEAEWHAGNTLSQSVYTLLYVHHLAELDPELRAGGSGDAARPDELVTLVLRAGVMGLLKCCDAAWSELARGGLQDAEDWQSEKSEVSLLEGTSARHVILQLDLAATWLAQSPAAPSLWREALSARILLRKALLQLMHTDVYKDRAEFDALIKAARTLLHTIRAHPSSEPAPGSPSLLAFDPFVARRLNTFIPIRVLDVRAADETWDAVDALLDGWRELGHLSSTIQISTWEAVGHLRHWLPSPPPRIAYIRSCTQTAFYNGVLYLNKFGSLWLVDRFFTEAVGVSYDKFVQHIRRRWAESEPPRLTEVERQVTRLVQGYTRALWDNPPRRRRYFMKHLVEWHTLYDLLLSLTSYLHPDSPESDNVVTPIPYAALTYRLAAIREVVLSGFQLELYTGEEKAFAYWYAAQVIEAHLVCVDTLVSRVPQESTTHRDLVFQQEFLTALQAMCSASFAICLKLMSSEPQRMRLNFRRRYKWAFDAEYGGIDTPDAAAPNFGRFVDACREVVNDTAYSPRDAFTIARSVLVTTFLRLIQSDASAGWAGRWRKDRIELVQNLVDVCERLAGVPASMAEMGAFNVARLRWDPRVHPWFPLLEG